MNKNQIVNFPTTKTLNPFADLAKPIAIPSSQYPEVADIAYYAPQESASIAKPSLIARICQFFRFRSSTLQKSSSTASVR